MRIAYEMCHLVAIAPARARARIARPAAGNATVLGAGLVVAVATDKKSKSSAPQLDVVCSDGQTVLVRS